MVFARGERRRDHPLKTLPDDLGAWGAERSVRLQHRPEHNPQRLIAHSLERFLDFLRPSSNGDLKETHSKTVDISSTIDEGTIFLFRRHIPRRPCHAALAPLKNSDPKISELHLSAAREQDVRGFYVAVDDPAAAAFDAVMRAREPAACLGADIGDDRRSERDAAAYKAHQIDAVDPLHREVITALGHSEIEDGDDIGMAELHREPGLFDKRLDAPIFIGLFGEDALDADGFDDTRRAIGERPIDLAHPPMAELLDEEIAPKSRILHRHLFDHLLLVLLLLSASCVPMNALPDSTLAIVLSSNTEAYLKGEEVAKSLERHLKKYGIQTAARGPKRAESDKSDNLTQIEELFFDVRLDEADSRLKAYLEGLEDIAIPVDPELLARAHLLGARIAEARGREEAFEAHLKAARRASGAKRLDRRRHPPSIVARYGELPEPYMTTLEVEGIARNATLLLNGAPATLGDEIEAGKYLLEVHAHGKRSERRWIDVQNLPIHFELAFDPGSLNETIHVNEPIPIEPSESQRSASQAAGFEATLLSAYGEEGEILLSLHLPRVEAPLRAKGMLDDSGDLLAFNLLAPLEERAREREQKVKARRRGLLISAGAAVLIGTAFGVMAAQGVFEREPTWHGRGKIEVELSPR